MQTIQKKAQKLVENSYENNLISKNTNHDSNMNLHKISFLNP